jgi:hypothetical protein
MFTALGIVLVLVAIFTALLALGVWSVPTSLPLPFWVIFVILYSLLLPELVFLYLVPRRFPIVGRLGISPSGLRLVFPLRKETVPWRSVRRLGTDWVEISQTLGSQRYRLTSLQAERLTRFLQTH